MEQMTMFEALGLKEPEEKTLFKEALKRGGIVEGFQERLKEALSLPDNEFTAFLKKEFGVGGYCVDGLDVLFRDKGMIVSKEVWDEGRLYSWSVVASRYRQMYGYGGAAA